MSVSVCVVVTMGDRLLCLFYFIMAPPGRPGHPHHISSRIYSPLLDSEGIQRERDRDTQTERETDTQRERERERERERRRNGCIKASPFHVELFVAFL